MTAPEVLEAELRVGRWLVWDASSWHSSSRYEAAEIVKVTAKTLTYKGTWGRETRKNIDASEVWAGPEAQAKALAERLNSSSGLMVDELRRSRERHRERVSRLVQAARQSRGGEG